MGSVVVAPRLWSTGSIVFVAHRHLLHSMWDLPGSAIEPVSLALAGKFFTLEPLPYSGKPKTPLLIEDKKLFLKKCKVFVSSGLAIAMLYEFTFLFLEWCLY